MRLFIAIPLSDAMKDALTAVQDEMYDNGVRGNFTSRENMHLTLAFIGEYPDKDQVMDALSTVSFSAFSLSLSGMGCFRDLWWAGMDESAPLHAVVRRIRHALADHNIPEQCPESRLKKFPCRWNASCSCGLTVANTA